MLDGLRQAATGMKAAGGTAVAVASDEAGRSGRPDAWKRDRLIGVGADVVMAGSLLAGTRYRGDFELRFKALIAAIQERENPILFIHQVMSLPR